MNRMLTFGIAATLLTSACAGDVDTSEKAYPTLVPLTGCTILAGQENGAVSGYTLSIENFEKITGPESLGELLSQCSSANRDRAIRAAFQDIDMNHPGRPTSEIIYLNGVMVSGASRSSLDVRSLDKSIDPRTEEGRDAILQESFNILSSSGTDALGIYPFDPEV